ncbi:MAG: hypothetical protein U0470_12450 [Anaerolineae bacterium]
MITRTPARFSASTLAAALALAATVGACGGAATDGGPSAAPTSADAANVAGSASAVAATPAAADPVGAAGDDVFVVDHVAMADQPCHVMGNTIMGRCARPTSTSCAPRTRSPAMPSW